MGVDHYPARCSFCGNTNLTFHVEKGAKVVDKACDCKRSKEYFGTKKKEVSTK